MKKLCLFIICAFLSGIAFPQYLSKEFTLDETDVVNSVALNVSVSNQDSVINTPGIAYIQNDTITGTRIISADSLYIGRDVTDTKEYGDVILGQGDITLNAKSVIIKNSTTIPLGTKLKIENP